MAAGFVQRPGRTADASAIVGSVRQAVIVLRRIVRGARRAAAAWSLLCLAALALAACSGQPAASPTPVGEAPAAISANNNHACALRRSGAVVCWGSGGVPPPEDGPYAAVSVGYAHTCALRDDGSAVCRGRNDSREHPTRLTGSGSPRSAPGSRILAPSARISACRCSGTPPRNSNVVRAAPDCHQRASEASSTSIASPWRRARRGDNVFHRARAFYIRARQSTPPAFLPGVWATGCGKPSALPR